MAAGIDALAGVVVVPVTPFTADDRFDEACLTALVRRCDEAGVQAVTALGNTAEVFQLEAPERQAVLRAVAAGRSGAALLAGVSGTVREVLAAADEAADLGYDALMLHDPQAPLAVAEGLAAYVLEVASEAPLPVVPYVRSPRWTLGALAEVVAHERVVAVKHARADVTEVAGILTSPELADACQWICGSAESMLPVWSAGGVHAFTSGLACVEPELALELWRAAVDGRSEAFAAAYRRVLPFERLRLRDSGRYNIGVLKCALREIGIDAGEVRPPCAPVDRGTADEVRAILRSWE